MKILQQKFLGPKKLWVVKYIHNGKVAEVVDPKLDQAIILIERVCDFEDKETCRLVPA